MRDSSASTIDLKDSFWFVAGKTYSKLIRIPIRFPEQMYVEGWSDWANFALKNNMQINSVYLSRYDDTKLKIAKNKLFQIMNDGNYSDDSLYIIDDDMVIPVLLGLKNSSKNIFFRIDSINVVAPNWFELSKTKRMPGLKIEKYIPLVKINEPIYFSKGKDGTYFLFDIGIQDQKDLGWGYPEDWGVWIGGVEGSLILPIPSGLGSPAMMALKFRLPPLKKGVIQNIKLIVNGVSTQIALPNETEPLEIRLSAADILRGHVLLRIVPQERAKPKDLGLGDDERLLSFGLVSVTFH